MPGIISSVILFVSGAIAYFAYSDSVWTWTSGGEAHSLHVDTIGMILMAVGLVTLLLSVAYNFMSVSPVDEEEHDVIVTKKPGQEPKKIVRKKSRRNY